MPPAESVFQRLQSPPPADLPEPLPSYFHVPLQQYVMRQLFDSERTLTKAENKRWTEFNLLSYILHRRGDNNDNATPRLLTPELLKHLNEVEGPETDLPVTRFFQLLCERISPFDRIADLRTRESRLRFYLDFVALQNINFKVPSELVPEFVWKAMAEEDTRLPKPPGDSFPLSYALAHLWRKSIVPIPFHPEDANLRLRFLAEFLRAHAAHGLDPRLIPSGLAKAINQNLPEPKPSANYLLTQPAPAPLAPVTVNLWVWDDPRTIPTHVSRRLSEALKASGVPFSVFHSGQKEKAPAAGPINLFACSVDQLSDFMLRGGLPYFENRVNIGFCSWDTSRLPTAWTAALDLLDEIWVSGPSQQQLFKQFTKKPVEVIPLPINHTPPAPHITRKSLEIAEDTYVFLQVFDASDSLSRKNILGAVDAFQAAFKGKENVCLLIKMRGHDRNLSAREEGIWTRLKRRIEKDMRILLLHEEINDAEQAAIVGLCDAVVSLHRASSFGATVLEAAHMGKAIIASACGGPKDYLPKNACAAIPVIEVSSVFDVSTVLDREMGHHWHDPDLAEAAAAMRKFYEKGRQENEKVDLSLDTAACGKRMAARLTSRKEEAA